MKILESGNADGFEVEIMCRQCSAKLCCFADDLLCIVTFSGSTLLFWKSKKASYRFYAICPECGNRVDVLETKIPSSIAYKMKRSEDARNWEVSCM